MTDTAADGSERMAETQSGLATAMVTSVEPGRATREAPAETTEAYQEAAEARVMIGPALRLLRERDRYVVRLRYFEGLTQREIGDELGVTQTQVSRILSPIIAELRERVVPERDAVAA